MPSSDYYILVYRQHHVVAVEHGQSLKTDQPIKPALKTRWHLFTQLYDYHNMQLLDLLKAFDETGKLTLQELRQKVINHERQRTFPPYPASVPQGI